MIRADRLRVLRDEPPPERADYVLYWMIATRRTRYNAGLEASVREARRLGKPLLVLEPVSVDYAWASDRFHRFLLDGMDDTARACAARGVAYYPYLEPHPGQGRGLLETLARRAAAVFTDETPAPGMPRLLAAAGRRIGSRFVAVDSNGLLPLRGTARVFPTAHAFRRYLQRELGAHLAEAPARDPLRGPALPTLPALPAEAVGRWPPVDLTGDRGPDLAALPIDHGVRPTALRGGARAARRRLNRFVAAGLAGYAAKRSRPDDDATSGLSPYLHFGHLSPHEILEAVAKRERWTLDRTSSRADGRRAGWWNLSADAEAFLDQAVTWRELGYNAAALRHDVEEYESLPPWALATLAAHQNDPREYCYSPERFEAAATHDPLWNAAQVQLVREGRIHNMLRMLWGKKILEWSASPREALAVMLHLNNKYALDGRDPNSTSGIFWILGRYDRPWGPRRPVFGTVRYMSSANTARKVPVKRFLARYAPEPGSAGE